MSDNNNIFGFSLYPHEPEQNFYTPITPEPQPEYYSPYIPQEPQVELPYQSEPEESQTSQVNSWLGGVTGGVAGYLGGKTSFEGGVFREARSAFYEARDSIARGVSATPGLLVDAAKSGMNAMKTTYEKYSVNPSDIYGANILKANEHIANLDPTVSQRFTNQQIVDRIKNNSGPGDYVVRIIPSKELNNLQKSKIAPANQTFVGSLDELSGYFNNGKALANDAALPLDIVNGINDGTHVALIYTAKDLGDLIPATWDKVQQAASKNNNFQVFTSRNPNFWTEVKDLDYGALKEKKKNLGELFEQSISPKELNIFE